MIWAVCDDLDVSYADSFVLYQSEFFEPDFPEENERFRNVRRVPSVEGDRASSLLRLREQMLDHPDLNAGVFIGGMPGVEDEYWMLRESRPEVRRFVISSTGGAAARLGDMEQDQSSVEMGIDYASFFRHAFGRSTDSRGL